MRYVDITLRVEARVVICNHDGRGGGVEKAFITADCIGREANNNSKHN